MQIRKNPISQRRLLVVFILLLLFVQSITIPFRHTFRVPCYLAPVTVWKLKYDGTGQVNGVWEKSILHEDIRAEMFHFDRPDIVEFRLHDSISDGCKIVKGEIIGWIHSRESSHLVKITEAELGKARATELALKAGERSVDIEVERENLNAASYALEAYEQEYQRVKRLLDQKLVSESEFQIASGHLKVLTATRDLAKARIRALESGARSEDVRIAEAEVKRLERDLDRISDILGNEEAIHAPFTGLLRLGSEPDVLLSLVRVDTLDATLIMPASYSSFVVNGTEVRLQVLSDPDNYVNAAIEKIEYLTGDSSGMRAHIYLPNKENRWMNGMTGYCEMQTDRITLIRSMKMRMGRYNYSWTF
ncbi:MAG: hypothetical protein OEM52_08215 [bacterium]|nr:hypothetical protein [bacterium]